MTLRGKIIKGIGGFYYVHTGEGDFECRAKGIFRNRREKPLVGDEVELSPVQNSERERSGNLIRILRRKNQLLRPEVSNVDQAVVLFSLRDPSPSLPLLDRFLIHMEMQEIPVRILFNKADLLVTEEERERALELQRIYEGASYSVRLLSVRRVDCREELLSLFRGKSSVLSGPSGVGKSSLINLIHPEARMETGELSRKIRRGKNTTRHTEFFYLDEESYVMDTPGFSSLYVSGIEAERLRYFYPEFEKFRGECRYKSCVHIGEPLRDCRVKRALSEGEIPRERYESYRQLYRELRDQEERHG